MQLNLAQVSSCLDAISSAPSGLTVTELAEKLGVSTSTASRLLSSMVAASLVERLPHSQKHVIAAKLWSIGVSARRAQRVTDVALGPMIEFVERHDVPVAIAINRDLETIYLQLVERMETSTLVTPLGARAPAHSNACGRSIIAFMAMDERLELINTICSSKPASALSTGGLLSQLDEIRNRGFASTSGELQDGRCGIACPIFDLDRGPIAAVSVSCSANEWDDGFEQQFEAPLRDLARRISRYLGYESIAGRC